MDSQVFASPQRAGGVQRDVATPVVDRHGSSVTRRIAPEIMAEIFIYCLPTAKYPRPSIRKAPLVLCRVCRLWRMIAFSTPRLWARLLVGSTGHKKIDVRALEEWISKSCSLPLSIKLGRWVYQSSHEVSKVIENILLHSTRWENVNLDVPWPCVAQISAAFLRGTPLLRYLQISTQIEYDMSDSEVIDVSSAPKLRRLVIDSSIRVHLGDSIRHTMRTIQLAYCSSIDLCLGYLELCPMLECFSVTIIPHKVSTSDKSFTILKLPHLLKLDITAEFVDPSPILDRIQAPGLKTLVIDICLKVLPQSWPHLYALLKRSNAPLKKLHITDAPLSEGGILDCLALVPSLESLSLGNLFVTDITMRALTRPSGPLRTSSDNDVYLCPHLKDIAIFTFVPFKALAEMICSRWDGSRSGEEPGKFKEGVLRSITVAEEDYDIIWFEPGMSRCIKEGFDLRVKLRGWESDDEGYLG